MPKGKQKRTDGSATMPKGGKRKRADGAGLAKPAELLRHLLSHREKHRLNVLVAPEEQPEPTDVWGLCKDYEEEDFDAMDDDVSRNAAYVRAFQAVPSSQSRWLEIGCGASATLTKLALHHGPASLHITAFEVNHLSAAAAAETLSRSSERVSIVAGPSTRPELLGSDEPSNRFDVVLHEIFGTFASSEGCPPMLAHARAHYFRPPRARRQSLRALCRSFHPLEFARPPGAARGRPPPPPRAFAIPARTATFFVPCELRSASLDGCETVMVRHRRPNTEALPTPVSSRPSPRPSSLTAPALRANTLRWTRRATQRCCSRPAPRSPR